MAQEEQKSAWWMDLRGEWETEPLAHTWQHAFATAVAVIVCLMLAALLHLQEAYWAAISVVVVLQPDMQPTVSAARDRLLGTAVGAVMGWLAALVWHGNVLVFGLAMAISFMMCGILGLKNAKRLAGAIICLVALVPAAGPKWRMALDRFVAVSFGIVVAVVISWLLHRWTKPRG